MKKTAFIFPSYESMWLFKSCTQAIHIRIEPRKHLISGLFHPEDVEMAITRFKAIPYHVEAEEKLLANEKATV